MKEINYCKKCGHTGYIRIDDNTLTHCECYKSTNALKTLYNQGLGYILERYTFDRYTTNTEITKHLYKKAQDYLNEKKKWFTILGQSGCVDCDTEYFDGKKWKKISNYNNNDLVLQYNPKTKESTLTKPIKYVNEPCEKLYQINTIRGSINMCLSADHDFAYITSKGNMNKKPFSEVMELHKNNIQGFYGKVETAFNYNGKGIKLSENEIRLMCAVIADGSFIKNTNYCNVNVKKERKKVRMRWLLKDYKYKEYIRKNGYSVFKFCPPRKEKEFTEYWYDCSNEQLKIIADEVLYWDGTVNGKRKLFFSTSKKSADFVQFAFSATGHRSTISIDNIERKKGGERKTCYSVNCVSSKSLVSMVSSNGRNKATITEIKPKDNRQYCFTVETGYLVLRRNNRIFITGNCGKTHICIAIINELIKKNKECYIVRWVEFVSQLNAYVNTEQYFDLMDKVKNYEVLYIDDFLKPLSSQNPTTADLKKAYEIIDYRLINNKQTIISSERSFDELISLDEATAGRIYQMSQNYLINLKKKEGGNLRLKNN